MPAVAVRIKGHPSRYAPRFTSTSALQVIGVAVGFASPLCLYWLFAPARDFTNAGLVFSLFEVAAAMVAALHLAQDRFETVVFGIGLVAKLAAAGIYLKLCYTVYAANDAFGYFDYGLALSTGGTIQFVHPFWSTNALYDITAVLVGLGTPSITFAFCTFSLIAFFGQMLFYRAFCSAVPGGDRLLAALMCFFFPSFVFWTTPIGKDAIVLFGLGLASLGAARLFGGRSALMPLSFGIVIVQFIRPHIAALFGVSLAISYLFFRRSSDVSAVLAKFVLVPALVILTVGLTLQTKEVFGLQTVEGSITRADEIRSFTGSQGGSDFGFNDSLEFRLATAPFLLIRPFPWEVVNVLSGIASAEGVFIVLMLWSRRLQVVHFFRNWRLYPFISFVVIYALFTISSLSTVINNMGTIARQRVMVFPLFLVAACVGFRGSGDVSSSKGLVRQR
jgi:hypothetical protein